VIAAALSGYRIACVDLHSAIAAALSGHCIPCVDLNNLQSVLDVLQPVSGVCRQGYLWL